MGKSLNISLVATLTPLQKSLELVGKMMSDFAKSIETTDKKLSDSIKASVSQMNTELAKVQSSFDGVGKAGGAAGEKGGKGMKSLRSQIREATLEAQRAAEQFGEFSPEFIEAAKRAAELRDKFGDMNDVIAALNPDAKMKAFGGVVKGVVGGFQAAQGALAAFGVESEDAQKTMAKLQGLMALSSGINELGALADSMKAFKIATLASLPALNTLKGAIIATGIGALVVAVGLLVANWDKVEESLSGVTAEQKKQNELLKTQVKTSGEELKLLESQNDLMKLQGLTIDQIAAKKQAATTKSLALLKQELDNAKKAGEQAVKNAVENAGKLPPQLMFLRDLAGSSFSAKDAKKKADDEIKVAQEAYDEMLNKQSGYILESKSLELKALSDSIEIKIKQAQAASNLAATAGKDAKTIYNLEVAAIQIEKEKYNQIILFAQKNKGFTGEAKAAKLQLFELDTKIATTTAAFQKKAAEDRAKEMADLKKANTETEAAYNERIEFTLSAQKKIKKASEIKPSAAPNATTDIAMPKMAGKQILIGGVDRKTLEEEFSWRTKMYANYNKKVAAMSESAATKSADYSAALNKSITDMTAKSLVLLGDSIAQMFTGDFSAKNFLNSMLLIVADFATQLGTAFIGIAASTDSFKVALGGLPGVAIAIGVGLVAVGGAIKAGVSKMSEKPKASYAIGSRYIPYDMTAQIHKGEMIIPASENPYANSGGRVMPGGSGGGVMALSTTLRGNDIRISAKKTNRTYNRITGRG